MRQLTFHVTIFAKVVLKYSPLASFSQIQERHYFCLAAASKTALSIMPRSAPLSINLSLSVCPSVCLSVVYITVVISNSQAKKTLLAKWQKGNKSRQQSYHKIVQIVRNSPQTDRRTDGQTRIQTVKNCYRRYCCLVKKTDYWRHCWHSEWWRATVRRRFPVLYR